MTYEQKAEEVARECVESLCTGCMGDDPCIDPSNENCGCHRAMYDIITTALREAGNAKLGEAARVAESRASNEDSEFGAGMSAASEYIAEDIRSLIQKD